MNRKTPFVTDDRLAFGTDHYFASAELDQARNWSKPVQKLVPFDCAVVNTARALNSGWLPL